MLINIVVQYLVGSPILLFVVLVLIDVDYKAFFLEIIFIQILKILLFDLFARLSQQFFGDWLSERILLFLTTHVSSEFFL